MIVVNSKEELIKLIGQRIEEQGPECDLNDIDVSKVKDMCSMFHNSPLEGREPMWYTIWMECYREF